MNRLAHEQSPYLLQHAANPVDWYPWGEEAFARARAEDKPIFLSIGYSTCHWCHVMEHESFVSPAIADQLNRDFVSIKVDREERPDVDRVYMAFVQATTGSGGWPMTVFLTPDLEAVLRRHVLPAAIAVGAAGVRRPAAGDRQALEGGSRACGRGRARAVRAAAGGHRERRDIWRRRRGRAGGARRRRRGVREELRHAFRRLRRGAEVSASLRGALPAA
jgi:hypothetical protein